MWVLPECVGLSWWACCCWERALTPGLSTWNADGAEKVGLARTRGTNLLAAAAGEDAAAEPPPGGTPDRLAEAAVMPTAVARAKSASCCCVGRARMVAWVDEPALRAPPRPPAQRISAARMSCRLTRPRIPGGAVVVVDALAAAALWSSRTSRAREHVCAAQ